MNLFQFSQTAPSDGEIRALVKEDIDGTKIIRALTVDNNSLNSIDIVPTLQSIQSVNMKLTSSLEVSNLQKLTVAEKIGYFFIDNIDISLATVSSSLSSSVTFDPFVVRSFDNDDYNALFSNAVDYRPSTDRYILDRVSGDPYPQNFEAALGIETRTLRTDNATTGSNPIPTGSIVTNFNDSPSHQFYYTGSIVRFPNDKDITLSLTVDEISSAIGDVSSLFSPGTIEPGPNDQRRYNITLLLVVDAEPEMNGPFALFQNIFTIGYTRIGTSAGSYDQQTIQPFEYAIPSGSMVTATPGTGTDDPFFYVRLDVILGRTSPNTSTDITDNITARPNLLGIDKAKETIDLRYNINLPSSGTYQPEPYATPASTPASNYTSVGFSNARYNGSKTDANDYGGLEPSLTAQSITVLPLTEGPISTSFDVLSGSYARSWANMNNLLSGVSGSDGERQEYVQQYEDIFFAGLRDKPLATVGVVAKFYSGSLAIAPNLLLSNTDTSFDIDVSGIGDTLGVGDLISFVSGSSSGDSVEVVQITSKNDKINTTNGKNFLHVYNVTVIRGKNGVINNGHDPTKLDLTLNQGDRLLTIDGTRIIPQQQLRAVLSPEEVKDSPADMTIVETDFRGFIVKAYTSASQDGT